MIGGGDGTLDRWARRALTVDLRYVAKRELVWGPCIDLAGQYLPYVFVRRGASDTPGDVARGCRACSPAWAPATAS